MALLRCPVGLSGEIIAVFQTKKSQIDTEKDKTHKSFQSFCFFIKVSTGFADWNILRGQQGESGLSSRLSRRVYCSFLREIVSN